MKRENTITLLVKDAAERIIGQNLSRASLEICLEQLITLVKLHEDVQCKKIEQLKECIRQANEMFEFFADIYIDKKESENVERELATLCKYAKYINKVYNAPKSAGLSIAIEDNLLEV